MYLSRSKNKLDKTILLKLKFAVGYYHTSVNNRAPFSHIILHVGCIRSTISSNISSTDYSITPTKCVLMLPLAPVQHACTCELKPVLGLLGLQSRRPIFILCIWIIYSADEHWARFTFWTRVPCGDSFELSITHAFTTRVRAQLKRRHTHEPAWLLKCWQAWRAKPNWRAAGDCIMHLSRLDLGAARRPLYKGRSFY